MTCDHVYTSCLLSCIVRPHAFVQRLPQPRLRHRAGALWCTQQSVFAAASICNNLPCLCLTLLVQEVSMTLCALAACHADCNDTASQVRYQSDDHYVDFADDDCSHCFCSLSKTIAMSMRVVIRCVVVMLTTGSAASASSDHTRSNVPASLCSCFFFSSCRFSCSSLCN